MFLLGAHAIPSTLVLSGAVHYENPRLHWWKGLSAFGAGGGGGDIFEMCVFYTYRHTSSEGLHFK